MKKAEIPFLGILLIVIAISGCTSITTKHFDNGTLSFDYPANLTVKNSI
jgi:uncharacterized protein YceK